MSLLLRGRLPLHFFIVFMASFFLPFLFFRPLSPFFIVCLPCFFCSPYFTFYPTKNTSPVLCYEAPLQKKVARLEPSNE